MADSGFISIRNVSKRFGQVTAVNDVSLEIGQGEFFGLLGPSGCGKTTLLRLLAGFDLPSAGEIYIDQEATVAIPPYHRPVNMVFQNYAIFPHLNVFQNIAYGLRKQKLSKSGLAQKVNEALALIKLEGFGDRAADQLSGGQRQRVALARALVKQPKVLLLDEPLGALDKKLREQMQLELRDLQQELGITFVFVTHDQEEALTMSDRIAVMSEGRILETASPSHLYERPQSRFVADFLGSMNFMQGEIRDAGADGFAVATKSLGVLQNVSADINLSVGDRVTVAIRPENIRLSTAPAGEDSPQLRGIVGNCAYLGDRAHVYVRVDGAREPLLVAMQNIDSSISTTVTRDASVTLDFNSASVLLLKD